METLVRTVNGRLRGSATDGVASFLGVPYAAPPVGVNRLRPPRPVAPLTLIVTVGSVVERPAVHDGQIVPRPMLPLTLSFDHAVIDGAPAARFTETLRTLTETAAAF